MAINPRTIYVYRLYRVSTTWSLRCPQCDLGPDTRQWPLLPTVWNGTVVPLPCHSTPPCIMHEDEWQTYSIGHRQSMCLRPSPTPFGASPSRPLDLGICPASESIAFQTLVPQRRDLRNYVQRRARASVSSLPACLPDDRSDLLLRSCRWPPLVQLVTPIVTAEGDPGLAPAACGFSASSAFSRRTM